MNKTLENKIAKFVEQHNAQAGSYIYFSSTIPNAQYKKDRYFFKYFGSDNVAWSFKNQEALNNFLNDKLEIKRNIKVDTDLLRYPVLDGRLETTILQTLNAHGIIINNHTWDKMDYLNNYEVIFLNKGGRKNGRLFCIVRPVDTNSINDIIAGYWVQNIYRYNTAQRCILKYIKFDELDKMLYDLM